MKKLRVLLIIIICTSSGITIGGDYNSGKEKSEICAACHGIDGISQIKTYPILAGQHQNYLVHSLKGYRDGERKNIIMKGFAQNLSDKDIEDLSTYFSMQKGLTIPPPK
tara:strand:+ start:257 stop:583 length:327 start_codon:yes stop_codon:yes gene_type:complete